VADAPEEHVVERVYADGVAMVQLLGPQDRLLRVVEREHPDVDVHVRGNEITLTGGAAAVTAARGLVDELLAMTKAGHALGPSDVSSSNRILQSEGGPRPSEVLGEAILSTRGRVIRPKTLGQKAYVDAIEENTIVFGIGPAGTGKTYLAMAKAVQALQRKEVSRIILTRPAVEAGERLGFLPGTLNDKIDPYLRPLYDALNEMLDPELVPKLMASGTIEVAPLAYMRGRAQPLDARVLTPAGFVPIGSLEVGDLVLGSNGEPTPVLGVFPQGRKPVYRVMSQDGASTRCCGEHLWTVTTRDDKRRGKSRVVQTTEMMGRLRQNHFHRFELPIVESVQLPARSVPLDPYALGLLLGDGCITGKTTPSFSTSDSELVDHLQAALPGITVTYKDRYDYVLRRTGGGRGGVIVANPVTAALRELGLDGTRSETKFIPSEYLHNSVEVRVALLQGLLDSDGGPVVQRDRTCRVQYTTISPTLRDDVRQLVRSLGGVAYVRTRTAQGRKPGYAGGRAVPYRHDAFVMDIRLPDGIEPFRLTRKRELYASTKAGRPQRYVHDIVPDGEADTVCIQVAAADSLYVTDDYLLTHNTLNDSFVVLDEAQNTTPEQMKMFLTRLGFGTRMVVTGDITQVDLPMGASGLRLVTRVLNSIEDIHFAYLTSDDVVRHSLVGRIVDAYTEYDERRLAGRRERDEASEFANRADRRTGARRSAGPRDHFPQRGTS
jgi:phosphate starvation-inducible protein PhoH and related proteins